MVDTQIELGDIIPETDPNVVPLFTWRRVLKDGQPTGMCKRFGRKLEDVFRDLYAKLDVAVCDRCGHERKLKHTRGSDWAGDEHKKCGGKYEVLIDEYFSGPHTEWFKYSDGLVPVDYHCIACYAVTGGNEGWLWHVEFHSSVEKIKVPDGDEWGSYKEVRPARSENLWRVTRLAMGKTFRSMKHAQDMANRCALLLQA